MNHDGQMRQLLQLEYPEKAMSLISLVKNDGIPLTAKWITEAVLREEQD
jgi:hypothetical protein